MRRLIIATVCILLGCGLSFSQGTVTWGEKKPAKKEQPKKEQPKKGNTAKTKPSAPKQEKPKEPDPPKPKPRFSSTETINGFKVNWNNVNEDEKNAITQIISGLQFVEGDTYKMGYDPGYTPNHTMPVHDETVGPFYMANTVVTQEQYSVLMDPEQYDKYMKLTSDTWRPVTLATPQTELSRNQWQAYIDKLNDITGLKFRMPTEMEWEYAARGGNKTNNYSHSGSNNPEEVAWFDIPYKKPQPVATKKPNELGLYDMSGNVWEWTSSDWSETYRSQRNPDRVVIRGGSHRNSANSCTVWDRVSREPANSSLGYNNDVGLRLVLDK